MFLKSFFVTFVIAFFMASVSSAAPFPSVEATVNKSAKRGVAYTTLTGDGSTWPAMSAWSTFDEMWANNQDVMSISCNQYGLDNDSPTEIADIKRYILEVAPTSNVDPRVVLASIMQESKGCVRAPTSNGGVRNPGLMQDHNGANSCNDGGVVQTPCPASAIQGMIEDGTRGTASGDGWKQLFENLENSGYSHTAQAAYIAARRYNSGSYVDITDLSAPSVGTSCYASDIANRLLGWAAPATPCTLRDPPPAR